MLLPDIKLEPDFNRLRRALLCEGELERVPFLELKADNEVTANMMGVSPDLASDKTEMERWTQKLVQFWYELGHDAVRLRSGMDLARTRVAIEDTADLKRSQREWQSESEGPINSWEDFENFPWPRAQDADFSQIEYASTILPEGMKILVSPYGILEPAMWLMGFEPFALALYEDPALVEAIIEKITDVFVPISEAVLDMDAVEGLLPGDDMGYKTSTMIAPDHLRKYIFPYHKKLAELAHARDKVYVFHSCGNLEAIMDDLIDDVGIDAKHSFEDAIMPVEQFKAKYDGRIGVVGGIDVDFLARSTEDEIRTRVFEVLDACMPGGGYTLGTGNSVTNYIPVQNFLAMTKAGHEWRA